MRCLVLFCLQITVVSFWFGKWRWGKKSTLIHINTHQTIQAQLSRVDQSTDGNVIPNCIFVWIPNYLWATIRESASTLMLNKYCSCITRFFHLSSAHYIFTRSHIYLLIYRYSCDLVCLWTTFKLNRITLQIRKILNSFFQPIFIRHILNSTKFFDWRSTNGSKTIKLNICKINSTRRISYS